MRILHVGDDHAALRPCGLTFYSDAIMRSQAAAGHEVAYLFSGRHYPRLSAPRLKRWANGAVRMYELIGSPNHTHWEKGTRHPERDLQEPAGEAAFAAAVRETRPDVVHVHELSRLPSSIVERAVAQGLPVVMTLHDYKPLCASVRLLDADGGRCMRSEVGEDCARNCAGAPDGPAHLIEWTLIRDRLRAQRAKRAIPGVNRIDLSRLDPLVMRAQALLVAAGDGPPAEAVASPAAYQRRRDVNVHRLSLCDRLIAPSPRVAEIYGELGVDPERIVVQRLTLPHLERLVPGRGPEVRSPLTFVTLGGAAHPSKGSRILVEAVEALERAGRGGAYRLVVHGHVEPAAAQRLARVPSVSVRGFYALGDLDRLLDEGDVGLLPSVWEETHGFAGVEMLAKGLPIVGSALGGITEYVRDGETGWLNRSATGAELTELMTRALDDPGELARLRRCVRAARGDLVRPMSVHAGEVEALYADVVRGGP
jgi:glycosyltransferase involved in cell wall biosynthesis